MYYEQIRAWVATRRKPGLLTQTTYESIALHHIDTLLGTIDELEGILPVTFFADLELPQRVERMVHMWRKGIGAAHALDKVRALHTPADDRTCNGCTPGWAWYPCDTARILEEV
jgi:hypothetical protein